MGTPDLWLVIRSVGGTNLCWCLVGLNLTLQGLPWLR
jgi:hypothetical protein